MTNELIADMLTRLRNASCARHAFVLVPCNTQNAAILETLMLEGYIASYEIQSSLACSKWIKVFLRYKGWWIKKPFFSILNRVSKSGQRVFSGYTHFNKKIASLKYGQGLAVISTSSGIVSHLKAISLKKGGEILCYIE
uniref:Ribosomal protein S8 n=1 Tax=Spumella sp. Baekdong012001B8 TaxID=2782410 RepID=A0A7S6TB94_9STRA|nr:ribosomal protein S8 [Spumella sp. Baekdong012001B8]